MPENWSWQERGNYWHADASARDVAALDAKYTKELADAKAENDARDDVAAGRRQFCASKQSVSQCVKPPPPPAWIMQPPPDWQTPLNGIISPSKLITMQKQLEEPKKYINKAVQIELPISMGNSCNYCRAIHALPAGKYTNNKNRAICLRMFCWVSVLTTFSAPPQILAASTVFLLPQFQKRRNDGWWFPLVLLLPVLFWTVNVCWAHPVISRASAVAVAFSWCYSRYFWSSQNRILWRLSKP